MAKRLNRSSSRLVLFALVAACLTVVSCGRPKPLQLQPLIDRVEKRPVILLPGFSGSALINPHNERVVWGNSVRVISPRDGGYELALPVLEEERDLQAYEARGVVLKMRFGIYTLDIYGSLVEAFTANGYTAGDIHAPTKDDNFFVFPYDWRYNNVRAAERLSRALERLRVVRGDETLEVDIICQSNAARIARYYIKYDGAPMKQAEAGDATPPQNVIVKNLFLVGTANGGATNGFRNLLEGRSYAPLIGRTFQPEVAFSFEAAFETMPSYRAPIFFDEEGSPLDVDIFDADNWKKYGWSIYSDEVAERLAKDRRRDLFGNDVDRADHLQRSLSRAQRLHQLLRADAEGFPSETRYHSIQNAYRPTRDRTLLTQDKEGKWQTIFPAHKKINETPLKELAYAPGDGHATLQSQEWLSPQEQAALEGETLFVPVYHRLIIRHETTHQSILRILAGM
jgi:hypothetical protein